MEHELSPVGLPAIGPLATLAEDDRSMLASYGGFRFLRQGETIIAQGAPQGSLYLVITGNLHARRSDREREILVGEIHTGECFGEVNLFDPGAASATVVAASPTQIWSIQAEALNEFVAAYPSAGVSLLAGIASVLARRLRAVSEKLVDKAEYKALLAEIRG